MQARVRREGRRWYAVVCFEVNREHTVHNGHVVGVDRNVRQVADSDGEIHRMPDLERLNAKVRRHQRALSRKKKGSNRREESGPQGRPCRTQARQCPQGVAAPHVPRAGRQGRDRGHREAGHGDHDPFGKGHEGRAGHQRPGQGRPQPPRSCTRAGARWNGCSNTRRWN